MSNILEIYCNCKYLIQFLINICIHTKFTVLLEIYNVPTDNIKWLHIIQQQHVVT